MGADLMKGIPTGTVSHQTTLKDEGWTRIDCRNLVVRRQRQKFITTLKEPWKGTNDERARSTLDKDLQRFFKLESVANWNYNNFTPKRPPCLTYFARLLLECE